MGLKKTIQNGRFGGGTVQLWDLLLAPESGPDPALGSPSAIGVMVSLMLSSTLHISGGVAGGFHESLQEGGGNFYIFWV